MTLVSKIVKAGVPGVEIVDTPAALAAIHCPGTAALVWERRPEPAFQDWIDGLDPDLLPQARIVLRADAVREAVTQLAYSYGMPECDHRTTLIDDIAAMAEAFAAAMDTPYLRLRLSVVTTNACRKFHLDALTARLVCSYRGTGTQYGTSVNGQDPTEIFTTPTGAPIVMRGSLWPETPKSGLRHRSPPIEGTGEVRLVLVLDPITDLTEDD